MSARRWRWWRGRVDGSAGAADGGRADLRQLDDDAHPGLRSGKSAVWLGKLGVPRHRHCRAAVPENDQEGVVQHLVNTPTYIIAGLIALLMIAGIVVVIVRQRRQPSSMRPRPAIDRASGGPGEQRRVC
jgi:hypothetical protein